MSIPDTNLYFFSNTEFERGGINWYWQMDDRLLVLLDVFRFRWGAPVNISPHPKAIGRYTGRDDRSDHNLDHWAGVFGIDVMPSGLRTREDMERAFQLARAVGFTSIGVYPHWQPIPGLHLGTRRRNQPGDPATWGAVSVNGKQKYTTVEAALAVMKE